MISVAQEAILVTQYGGDEWYFMQNYIQGTDNNECPPCESHTGQVNDQYFFKFKKDQ